ncbi:MAG: hypothetical protein GY724_10155, partial [Actinomycetia bacterium]|nr:hypothetical protein [Actinomycetes bacterium]
APSYGWPDLFEEFSIGFRPAEAVDLAASMFPALDPAQDATLAEFGEAMTELGDRSGRWIDRQTGEIMTLGPKKVTLTISGGLIRVAVNDVRAGQLDDLDVIDGGRLDDDESGESTRMDLLDDEADDAASYVVEGFSRRSRNRCRAVGASVDWAGAKRSGQYMLMVTLTYPGDWRTCAPTPNDVLRHRRALELRFYRATGQRLAAMWKREFQDRGAPHIHLFGWWPWRIDGLVLTQWLSTNWFEIVKSGDPRHLLAGTGVDHRQSIKMSDPNRVGNYFASYMAKGKYKDYQNQAPADWTNPNGSVGRYWGSVGLERLGAEVRITETDMVHVERLLRGVLASQKRTNRTRLSRKGKRPGGLRRRMVNRRYTLPTLKGTGRGFMFLTNDGAQLGFDIARALDLPNTEPWPAGIQRPLP